MRQGEEQHGKAIFTLSYDQLTEARSAFEHLSEHNVSLTAVVDFPIQIRLLRASAGCISSTPRSYV
jgi:hypothetical protein